MIKTILIVLIIILLISMIIFSSSCTDEKFEIVRNDFDLNHTYRVIDQHIPHKNSISLDEIDIPKMSINKNYLRNFKITPDNAPDNTPDNSSDNSSDSSVTYHNMSYKQATPTNQNSSVHDDTENCEADKNKSCDSGKCGLNDLHPILEPSFNMREVAKQCILLEDHINNSKKRCFDCIRKHFLMIDGLLEESIGLEKDNKLRQEYRDIYLDWIKIEKDYAKNSTQNDNLDNISKTIRLFRKPLVEKYFDVISDYHE
jgi:hypothetical protein